jgi:sortase A
MRFLNYFGKFLISVGVGVLLFVLWTLYGTGLYYDRQQDNLAQEFDQLPALTKDLGPGEAGKPPKGYRPGPGEPVFRLNIPTIELEEIVVEGVGTEDLRKGPGHYPSCREEFEKPLCTEFPEAWPGEKGRVVVSGHRTTYGQPFWALNELNKGDEVEVETKWGDFTYQVTKKEIVLPSSASIVIQELDTQTLVLTTCNPRFSASQRLIIHAEMVEATAA